LLFLMMMGLFSGKAQMGFWASKVLVF